MVRTGTILALLWLPVAWALAAGMVFHVDNRDNRTLVSSGAVRSYLLHVPAGLDPARPAPLVISLHGAGAWPASQRDVSRWHELADAEGFIVVFPAGLRERGSTGPRLFSIHRLTTLDADIRFIADLIDTLAAEYNVDSTRIYVDGLSGGAGMAFALSCTIGDRIAAVGMVSSALILPARWCPDPHPMPMMAFHGVADALAPYHGGTSIAVQVPVQGVEPFTAAWARRNACPADPRETRVAANITRRAWTGCADDASVVLYTITDGGHTWPGSTPVVEWFLGPTSRDIDATRELWEFYRTASSDSGG